MQAIVAVDPAWGIGREGRLIYRIPEDLKRFRQMTKGQVVVMGRATFDSLPKGALPHRRNLVLSRQPGLSLPGAEVLTTTQALFEALQGETRQIYIMGGAQIYRDLLPYCDVAWVTRVHPGRATPDAFFPDLEDQALGRQNGWAFSLAETSPPHTYEDLTFTYNQYINACPKARPGQ